MRSTLLVLFALSFNISSYANDLSTEDAASVTRYLHDICGDSWCEGEFEWDFDNFRCDFSKPQCAIDLNLKDYKKEYRKTLLAELLTYPNFHVDEEYLMMSETCYLTEISSAEQALNTDDVYDQVSYCISQMEESFDLNAKRAEIVSNIKACSKNNEISDVKLYNSKRKFPVKDYYNQENALKELSSFAQEKVSSQLSLSSFYHLRYLFNHKEAPERCQLNYFELVDRYYVETMVASEPNTGYTRNQHKFFLLTEKNLYAPSKTKILLYLKSK